MPEDETKEVAEIVTDEQGNWLWTERYILSRMSAVGELFIRDYKEYKVVSSHFTKGLYGGGLVEHVCQLIADRTPEQQEIKTPIRAGKLQEVLEAKNQELHRTIEQICGGTIHAQLKRIGIVYNIPTSTWRFLDVGQEKSLAALLYKLFEMHRWQCPTKLLLDDLREKGGYEEFCEWAAEHGIHLQVEGNPDLEQCEITFNRVTEQKELPTDDTPKLPDLREEGSADYPGL